MVFPEKIEKSSVVKYPIISELGFKGKTIDIKTFAGWFFKERLGFHPENIGFDDKSGRPVTYNMEATILQENLNVMDDYFVHLNFFPHFIGNYGTVGWFENIIRTTCEALQSSDPFQKTYEDSYVRQKIAIEVIRFFYLMPLLMLKT